MKRPVFLDPAPVLTSPETGLLYPHVKRDQNVRKGAVLARMADFFGKKIAEVKSPSRERCCTLSRRRRSFGASPSAASGCHGNQSESPDCAPMRHRRLAFLRASFRIDLGSETNGKHLPRLNTGNGLTITPLNGRFAHRSETPTNRELEPLLCTAPLIVLYRRSAASARIHRLYLG